MPPSTRWRSFYRFYKIGSGFSRSGPAFAGPLFCIHFPISPSMLDLLFTLDRLSLHSSAVPLHGRSHITSPVVLQGRGFLCVPPHQRDSHTAKFVEIHGNERVRDLLSTFYKDSVSHLTAARYTVRCSLNEKNSIVENPNVRKGAPWQHFVSHIFQISTFCGTITVPCWIGSLCASPFPR